MQTLNKMQVNSWLTLLFVGTTFGLSVSPSQYSIAYDRASRNISTTAGTTKSDMPAMTIVSTITTTSTTPTKASPFSTNSPLVTHRYINKRSTAVQPNETPFYCDRFIYPIMTNNTFFSPLDPAAMVDTYPPKADCTFVLEAPSGFQIRLDFRNKFHIEPSTNCEYDYLEIRDGKYGYSKELGRFCGTDFPPIIYSSDRYLWLRFHSDENIEYYGFEAVFDYMQQPTTGILLEETTCYMEKNGTEGNITRGEIDEDLVQLTAAHSIDLDCLWLIEVEPGWKIMLSFMKFDLDKKNDCDSNFIDVFGEITDIPSRLKHFCGVIAEPVESKTNILHVRFFAEKHATKSNFEILYTAFRKKALKTDECVDEEYDCEDETCIDASLVCNGRNNCKFQKDESECGNAENTLEHLLIIILVFSFILGAMTTVFFFNCIRKLIRDQKIIRETIRQSKESKLDEAGRLSLKRSLENINRVAPRTMVSSQSHPRSIHIIDDNNSGQYYREVVPVPTNLSNNSRTIFGDHPKYRNQEYQNKEQLELSQHSDRSNISGIDVDDANRCDMACQTRESLFAAVFRSKTQPTASEMRFSTFGYDGRSKAAGRHFNSSSREKTGTPDSSTPTAIELDAFNNIRDLPPPPLPPNLHKHRKMEESRVLLEIRNSAPDVIIMTSH